MSFKWVIRVAAFLFLVFGNLEVSDAKDLVPLGAGAEYSELQGFCKGGCRARFAEDRLGNVWIYGQNGLVKFDGTKVVKPDLKGILTTDEIHTIKRDGAALWVATDNELCRFDGKEWKKFSEADGLGYSTIGSIVNDDKGVLWFNTKDQEHGIYKYENGRFTKFAPAGIEDNDNLRFLGLDNHAVQWFILNQTDIYRLEAGRLILVAKGALPRTFLGNAAANYIVRVAGNNALWIALSGKVYRVGKDGLKQIPGIEVEGWFSDQRITFLFDDSRGTIWVGHGDLKAILNKASGVYRIDGDKVEHIDAASNKNLLLHVFEDSAGKLWFSSMLGFSGILQQLDGKEWKTVSQGPMDDVADAFFEDNKHNFWFGIATKGRFILHRRE